MLMKSQKTKKKKKKKKEKKQQSLSKHGRELPSTFNRTKQMTQKVEDFGTIQCSVSSEFFLLFHLFCFLFFFLVFLLFLLSFFNYFYFYYLCVCVGGGGGGVQIEKNYVVALQIRFSWC